MQLYHLIASGGGDLIGLAIELFGMAVEYFFDGDAA